MVPVHAGRILKPKTLAAILKSAEIAGDELRGSVVMSGMATYTILLDPDPDDGGYTVTVPALPGCVTEGETVVECVQNAEEAIRLYLDDLHDSGEPVPEEKVVPQAITVTVAA